MLGPYLLLTPSGRRQRHRPFSADPR